MQRLAHDGKRLASSISGGGLFDISCTQLGEVHPPSNAETLKMVCHGSNLRRADLALDAELLRETFRF
jgi:hypothetical protein